MEQPVLDAAAVELREGLGAAEVHRRLAVCLHLRDAGLRDAGQGGLAFYLADMHTRRLYQATGHASTAHFAEMRLEMSRRRARECIAAGEALRELPAIDAAFCAGALSWSKVVLLTRVVHPRYEALWLERASRRTCKALRLELRLARYGDAPRNEGSTRGLPTPRFDVRARLDALSYRAFELAKEKLSAERKTAVSDAEFLSVVAAQPRSQPS